MATLKIQKWLGITLALVGLLLLSGCGKSKPSSMPPSKPISAYPKAVQVYGEHYYYLPYLTAIDSLDAKGAYIKNITSSGILQCKKNDLFAAEILSRRESVKASKSYEAILGVSEYKELHNHPRKIPKINSKEFQNYIKVETKLARSGMTYCYPPMSKKKIKLYKAKKAKQDKINNDPQVIAARTQARAINAQARAINAQTRAQQYNATMSRIRDRNAQRNYNTQQTLNRMNTSNQSTNSIINGSSKNKFYIHSDGTSTRKVGNTYYHSNGTTTTAY